MRGRKVPYKEFLENLDRQKRRRFTKLQSRYQGDYRGGQSNPGITKSSQPEGNMKRIEDYGKDGK